MCTCPSHQVTRQPAGMPPHELHETQAMPRYGFVDAALAGQ